MASLDILAIGDLVRAEDGTIQVANSTSTLVRSGDRIIVVDASTPVMRPAIKTSFKQIGVFPKDVDTVILTHTHSDHVGNIDMFPNAELCIHEGEKGNYPNAKIITKDMTIAEGVSLVHTPGHTPGSMSVFVEADRKYAIAGDAVPTENNYLKTVPPVVNCDAVQAMQSLKFISNYADVIVPGHGLPFFTKKVTR